MYFVEYRDYSIDDTEQVGRMDFLHNPFAPDLYIEADNGGKVIVDPSVPRLYEGAVTKVLNAVDDFRFSILYGHPSYAEGVIKPLITQIIIRDTSGIEIFRGRALDPTYKMTSDGIPVKEWIAESELGFLVDSKQRVWEYHNITPAQYLQIILNNHNAQVYTGASGQFVDKRIFLGTVNVTNSTDSLYRYLAYDTSLQNIQDDLLNSLGGYISITHDRAGTRRLNYRVSPGGTGTISIELAKNLEAIELQKRPSEIITRLIPLGSEVEMVSLAVERLVNSGIITDPNYWLGAYDNYDFVGELLINLSKLNYLGLGSPSGLISVPSSIDKLSAAGAINSPDYWKGIYSSIPNLDVLLARSAYNLDANNTTYADASKPRLSIADVNGGKDYIDDTALMAKYGIIEGFVVWENVTAPLALLSKARGWLAAQAILSSVSISAVDLRELNDTYGRFIVGFTYVARNSLLGIDSSFLLTQQVINITEPLKSTLTFGDQKATISGYTTQIASKTIGLKQRGG